jgi:hypothetical protein
MTEQVTDINTEAKRLIDEALADLAGVNLVEATQMTDLLLDIRSALGTNDANQN